MDDIQQQRTTSRTHCRDYDWPGIGYGIGRVGIGSGPKTGGLGWKALLSKFVRVRMRVRVGWIGMYFTTFQLCSFTTKRIQIHLPPPVEMDPLLLWGYGTLWFIFVPFVSKPYPNRILPKFPQVASM